MKKIYWSVIVVIMASVFLATGCSSKHAKADIEEYERYEDLKVLNESTLAYTYGGQEVAVHLTGINRYYDRMILHQLRAIDIQDDTSSIGYAEGDHFYYSYNADGTITLDSSDYIERDILEIPGNVNGKIVRAIGSMPYNVSEYYISEGIKEINPYAFYRLSNDYGHAYVQIPDTVNYIGKDAFNLSESYAKKYCKTEVNSLSDDPDFLIVGDQILLKYMGEESIVRIPEGVKQIAAKAFVETEVYEIYLPDSLLAIGEAAFSKTPLRKIHINENLRCIDQCAFEETNISEIMLPDGLLYLGDGAFKECKKLESVDIPNRIYVIGETLFLGCEMLKSVSPGKQTLIIDDDAFMRCHEDFCLSYIPETLVSLGNDALDTTYELDATELLEKYGRYIDTVEDTVNTDNGDAAYYMLNDRILVAYSGIGEGNKIVVPPNTTCISGYVSKRVSEEQWLNENGWAYMSEVILPDSLVSIESNAFFNNDGLIEIIIPDNVVYIGELSFKMCDYLRKVDLPDKLRRIEDGAFDECTSLSDITIPATLRYINPNAFGEYYRVIKESFNNQDAGTEGWVVNNNHIAEQYNTMSNDAMSESDKDPSWGDTKDNNIVYATQFLGKSVQDVFDMGYTTELIPSPYFEGFYAGSSSNKDYNPVFQTDAYQVSFEEINAVFEVGSSAEGFIPEDVIMGVELFNNGINTVSIYPDIGWNTSCEEVKEVIGTNFETYEITVVRNYITDERATYFVDWIRKGDLVITLWRTNAVDKDIQAAVVFKQIYEDYAMDCLRIGPYGM